MTGSLKPEVRADAVDEDTLVGDWAGIEKVQAVIGVHARGHGPDVYAAHQIVTQSAGPLVPLIRRRQQAVLLLSFSVLDRGEELAEMPAAHDIPVLRGRQWHVELRNLPLGVPGPFRNHEGLAVVILPADGKILAV